MNATAAPDIAGLARPGAGVRPRRAAAGRAPLRRDGGVSARRAAPRGRARAHLLRPAGRVRRRRDRAPDRPLRGDRGALVRRLADRLGDRPGRLLRRAGARARLRRAEAALPAAALRHRPARLLRCDHRARARLRLGRDRDARAAGRRRLRDRRAQEVHRQRADRRPLCRLRDRRAGLPLEGDHGVRRRARRCGLRDRPAAAEDGEPLLPGRRAPLRGVLRPGRAPARRRGRGLQRPDARVRRRAGAARGQHARARAGGARARRRLRQGARGVRPADPRVPGGLVPPRRREAEARPGPPADPARRRARRRGQAVLDRGGDGEARSVRGVGVRDGRRGADARRRRLHPRLARCRSGTATRSSTRSGTARATSCA